VGGLTLAPFRSSPVRDILLPANLIVLALVVFGVLASSVGSDLRLVPRGGAGPGAGPADPGEHGKLTVRVVHVRNATGTVLVALYAHGPLQDRANVLARQALPASTAGVTAVFDDLPRGTYAVMAVHDENGNGFPDMGPGGGPPVEGTGTSGAVALTQGPPTFEDARFVLDRDELEIEIPVVYR
jgi:uncharacterized protein (DUF2141 family)